MEKIDPPISYSRIRPAAICLLTALMVMFSPAAQAGSQPLELSVEVIGPVYNKASNDYVVQIEATVHGPDAGDRGAVVFKISDDFGNVHEKRYDLKAASGKATHRHAFGTTGSFSLLVTASDGVHSSIYSKTILITGNRKPTLSISKTDPIFNKATQHYQVSLGISADDPDAGDVLRGEVRQQTSSGRFVTYPCSLPGTRGLREGGFMLTFDSPGTYAFEVMVRDSHGAEAKFNDTVVVFDQQHDPPTLTLEVAAPAYDQDTKLHAIAVKATVRSQDTSLPWKVSLRISGGEECTVDMGGAGGNVNKLFNVSDAGAYDIFAKAENGRHSVQQSARVIINKNTPPTVKVETGTPALDAGRDTYYLDIYVKAGDPDAGDALNGRIIFTPPAGKATTRTFPLIKEGGSANYSTRLALGRQRSYQIEVVIEDSQGATARWNSQVTAGDPKNHPPEITVSLQPLAYNRVTDQYIISATAKVSDADEKDRLIVTFACRNEQGQVDSKDFQLKGAARTVTKRFFFPAKKGSYTLMVAVNDGHESKTWNHAVAIDPKSGGREPAPEEDGKDSDGFSDEGSWEEEDGMEKPVETLPPSSEAVKGAIFTAPGDDFEDLGSADQPKPRSETVTYFDRDWLPQSWKTSGNAVATRAEIYQAASRLGWAAALAKYSGAKSDPLISDHLLAAAGHLQRAHAASFMPHKAWPDWQQRQVNYKQWIQRLASGSANSRAYFRQGLGNTISSEAAALKRQLETLARGQAGTLQNCDSYVFEIGFQLAFASQLQAMAIDGLKASQSRDWARKLRDRAGSSATSAAAAIRLIKPGPGRAGCSDFTPLSQELALVQSRFPSAQQPEMHGVWSRGLAIAAGSGGKDHDPDDLAGDWAMLWPPSSWGEYYNRPAETKANPNAWNGLGVHIELRGGEYVGTITHLGPVPIESDPYTADRIGQNRRHLFHVGLEYLRLKKTGRNLYAGTILFVNHLIQLAPAPIYIVVFGEAAKLHSRTPGMNMEYLSRENKMGSLMLRRAAADPSTDP